MACLLLSTPIQRRPSRWETDKATPEPAKQSSTMSPGFEDAYMIRANKFGFFSVGYPVISMFWL